jgi:RNA polymerase sigma-70 factor (ECF subfamily)
MSSAPTVQVPVQAVPSSEEVRVEQNQLGDPDGFAQLMRRYNQRLFRVARAITRDDVEAEDVVQQSYLAAFAHRDQFSGTAAFSTWLTRIVINEALARHREQRRMRYVAVEATAPDWRSGTREQPTPEDHVGRKELAALLETAIDALPDDYRAIVVLRELEGLSTREAADCLSITEEAARVRLHRARSLLRAELWQHMTSAPCEVFSFGGERCGRIVARVLEVAFAGKSAAVIGGPS